MRAAFVTAAIAAVVYPVAAAPIPGKVTSKGHIIPLMDMPQVLNSQENKPLNRNESLPRPETEAQTKDVYTTSLTSARAGATSDTIAPHAAAAGGSINRNQVRRDNPLLTEAEADALVTSLQAPSPTFDVHVGDIEIHNVDEILGALSAGKSIDEIHQAFHSTDGKPVQLTDDEVDSAIGAYYINAVSDLGKW